jgi:hypothetical protein
MIKSVVYFPGILDFVDAKLLREERYTSGMLEVV